MISTTSRARLHRCITNSIPYKPQRRAYTARSTCWASQNASEHAYCRRRRARSTAIRMCTPQVETYWGHTNPIGPRACYDEGKRCAETLFFDYHRQHALQIKVARIFNTYGPRMHPNDGRVVSNFIVQALTNQPITIYGDGSQTRSFCYVDDLIAGLTSLMETDADVTGPINLGNPNEFTIAELAELVIELSGSRTKIHLPRSANGRPETTATGYRPRAGHAGLETHRRTAGRSRPNDRIFRGFVGALRGLRDCTVTKLEAVSKLFGVALGPKNPSAALQRLNIEPLCSAHCALQTRPISIFMGTQRDPE